MHLDIDLFLLSVEQDPIVDCLSHPDDAVHQARNDSNEGAYFADLADEEGGPSKKQTEIDDEESEIEEYFECHFDRG